ncbi:MAG TPA: hypothetical protein VD913_00270 [bacterium]|nr:hypothetical protein [bacterium]
MSLIYFHAVLIGSAVLFFFGLGVWGVEHYTQSKKIMDLLTGVGAFTVACLFAIYLGWFVRKNFRKPS